MHTLNNKVVNEKLHIDGYSILLPQSWFVHHQVRLIVFVMDRIQLKYKKLGAGNCEPLSMSFELCWEERRGHVNFYYREYTSGYLVWVMLALN